MDALSLSARMNILIKFQRLDCGCADYKEFCTQKESEHPCSPPIRMIKDTNLLLVAFFWNLIRQFK